NLPSRCDHPPRIADLLAGSHPRLNYRLVASWARRRGGGCGFGSERNHPIRLLDRRSPFKDLIYRGMLPGLHSQVDGDTAEDIPGNLLEDQVAELLTDDHDLEDAGPAQVAGLEASRAAQSAMEVQVAMLAQVEFQGHQGFLVGRVGDPAIG